MTVPPLVVHARAAAEALRLEKSCGDEDGMLRHVLAGRRGVESVAEIGTGTGVGTVWLVSALPPGVALYTAEHDAELAGPRPMSSWTIPMSTRSTATGALGGTALRDVSRERGEAVVPLGPDVIHPCDRVSERTRVGPVDGVPPLACAVDEPRVLERREVLGDRLPRHRQLTGKLGRRRAT